MADVGSGRHLWKSCWMCLEECELGLSSGTFGVFAEVEAVVKHGKDSAWHLLLHFRRTHIKVGTRKDRRSHEGSSKFLSKHLFSPRLLLGPKCPVLTEKFLLSNVYRCLAISTCCCSQPLLMLHTALTAVQTTGEAAAKDMIPAAEKRHVTYCILLEIKLLDTGIYTNI